VRPFVIVMFAELRQRLPRIIQRNTPFHVQTLVSQSPVETFDEFVLHRTARPNETQLHVVAHHPSFQGPTAELTAIVHRNAARQTSSLCFGSLQRLGYLHSGHGTIRFQTDALPRELVHHVKMRNKPPSANLSLIKSMLQHWFGAVAVALAPR